MTMIPTLKPTNGSPPGNVARGRIAMDHAASHIIYYFAHENKIHIAKNRFTDLTGDVELDQFIDLSLELIANKAYSNTAIVFQEGLKAEMKEAIVQVFEKNLLKVEPKS